MLSRLSNTQKGILYALTGFSAFVISDSCAKWLTSSYPTFQIVAWTYLFTMIFGVLFSRSLGGLSATFKTKKMKFHIGRAICNFGLAVSVVIAFTNMPMTSVYPILFMAPFMITVFAIPFFKESVPPLNWLIIALGFSGVVIAFQPWTNGITPWTLVAFCTTIFISGLSLLARPLGKDETLLSLSFYPSIINACVLMPYALYQYGLPNLYDLPIFILAGLMLGCGMSGVASANRIARFSIIAPLHYSQLILVFLIGHTIFKEEISWWMIGGSCIIAISGILLALSDKKPIIAEH